MILTADQLLDTIGSGANWEYGPAYARWGEVVARWRELGIRHMRTSLWKGFKGDRNKAAFRALPDVRLTVVADHPYWYDKPGTAALNPVELVKEASLWPVEAIEVLNEPDHLPVWGNIPRAEFDRWPQVVQKLASDLAKTGTDVPLLAPALVHKGSNVKLGECVGWADGTAIHPYPGPNSPRLAWLDSPVGRNAAIALRPFTATETGLSRSYMTARQQAAGILRIVLTNALWGVKRTFIHKLVAPKGASDEPYALLDGDLNPTPAFDALKRFTGLLRDDEWMPEQLDYPHPLDVTVTGDVLHLVVDRGHDHLVFLWQDKPFGVPSTWAEVTVPGAMTAERFGTEGVQHHAEDETIHVLVDDWPSVVKVP